MVNWLPLICLVNIRFIVGETVCHCIPLCIELLPNVCRLLGYEGLEVINPDGGTDDAEEEALRGRWKQEVRISESSLNSVLL